MKPREITEQFISYYRENLAALNSWGDRLFEEKDPVKWARLLSERSIAIRELFAENERNLMGFQMRLPKEPNEEEADCLYDLLLTMDREEIHDYAVMSRIGNVIIPYFERTGQYTRLVTSLCIIGVEHTIFYRLAGTEAEGREALSYYRRGIAYREHFAELDASAKVRLLRCYRNFIMFTGHFHLGNFADTYPVLRELQEFRRTEAVLSLKDTEPEVWQAVEGNYAECCLTTLAFLLSAGELSKEALSWKKDFLYVDMQELVEKGFLDPISEALLKLERKEFTEQEMIEYLLSMVEGKTPQIDFSNPTDEAQVGALFAYMNLSGNLCEFLGRMSFSEEEKQAYADRFLSDALHYIFTIPYQYHTDMINSLMAEFFHVAQPYLRTEDEKIQVLLKLIIRRQPITYIHSLMVAKIAQEIAAKSIHRQPEEWIGVLGCKTAEEVATRSEELVTYAYRCGMMHDAGKCYITDVINRQNRALDRHEFGLIRKHPELGPQIVGNDEALAAYFDIMRGHHKYYDGSEGYPEEFDNLSSPIRFCIDLITIADTMDAATDVLGRNYAKGKDFAQLFAELKDGSGTHYNPRIVNLIEECQDLYDKLAYITSQGRYKIYREAYREIMEVPGR